MNEKEISNRLNFLICCINVFAEKHQLSGSQSYKYLRKFLGLDFLQKFYDIEHTFSIDDAIADASIICKRNGGAL